jgi:hypothetical protein
VDYRRSARFYSTTLGRFASVDPVVGSAGDPQSWNGYSYVRNNPLRYTDPTGMYFEEPGDSSPAAQRGEFCGRYCRGLLALGAAGLDSPEKVQAEIDRRNFIGSLQYCARNDCGSGSTGPTAAAAGIYVAGLGATVLTPIPGVDEGTWAIVGGAVVAGVACYEYCSEAVGAAYDAGVAAYEGVLRGKARCRVRQ